MIIDIIIILHITDEYRCKDGDSIDVQLYSCTFLLQDIHQAVLVVVTVAMEDMEGTGHLDLIRTDNQILLFVKLRSLLCVHFVLIVYRHILYWFIYCVCRIYTNMLPSYYNDCTINLVSFVCIHSYSTHIFILCAQESTRFAFQSVESVVGAVGSVRIKITICPVHYTIYMHVDLLLSFGS